MNGGEKHLFAEPVAEIIRRRRSVRTYSKAPVSADLRERVMEYARHLAGPFRVPVRFEFLDRGEVRTDEGIRLGTYGMIWGASSFIGAAIKKKEHYLEELGYVFESLILYLTSLGLGTCWMAGTFSKGGFSKAMRIAADEALPIVSPIGYASERRSVIDILVKPSLSVKKRKPWDELFFKNRFDTPMEVAEAGIDGTPLEMVRLAPSASNNQPWRIVKADGRILFYLAHDPAYARRYPYDIQKIDMGIAMFHFACTANELGRKGRWETEQRPLQAVPEHVEYIVTWVPEQ